MENHRFGATAWRGLFKRGVCEGSAAKRAREGLARTAATGRVAATLVSPRSVAWVGDCRRWGEGGKQGCNGHKERAPQRLSRNIFFRAVAGGGSMPSAGEHIRQAPAMLGESPTRAEKSMPQAQSHPRHPSDGNFTQARSLNGSPKMTDCRAQASTLPCEG